MPYTDRAPQGLSLAPAGEGDFEALLALRMAAMRESLEKVGRFDPQRARERLSRGTSTTKPTSSPFCRMWRV
jgi:hypothetical protein